MSHSSTTSHSSAQAMRDILAKMWEKNLPILRQRLDQLQAATDAAEAGTLTAEQRHEAASTAHKLAGSLGMFGHPKGTEQARALEQKFDSEESLEKAGLGRCIVALRSELAL